MATRQEVQMALDLMKRINVANDLFDDAAVLAKTNSDVEDTKLKLVRYRDNIMNYYNTVNNFLSDNTNRTKAASGFLGIGIDVDDIISDNTSYETHVEHIKTMAELATTKKDLEAIATYIESNVDNLLLVRKNLLTVG